MQLSVAEICVWWGLAEGSKKLLLGLGVTFRDLSAAQPSRSQTSRPSEVESVLMLASLVVVLKPLSVFGSPN